MIRFIASLLRQQKDLKLPNRNYKYHIVYKTINLENDHYYIGVHSTNDLDDKYLGSGKRLKAAIKKYGRENFKREIIYFCGSRKGAFELEKEILNSGELEKAACYNMAEGGDAPPILRGGDSPAAREVHQYDMEGNYVQSWNSIADAARNYDISAKRIHKCLVGTRRSAVNFQWSYKKVKKMKPYKIANNNRKSKKVRDKKTGKIYLSTRKAAAKIGIHNSTVSGHARNHVKDPRFEFVNDDN